MVKILLAVDGSESSLRATRSLIETAQWFKELPQIELVTVHLPVPHVGWARVELTARGRAHSLVGPAFGDSAQFFYHVHSYHPAALPEHAVLATGEYGGIFPTLVGQESVIGAQFHPEKSQQAGIALLSAFARWTP